MSNKKQVQIDFTNVGYHSLNSDPSIVCVVLDHYANAVNEGITSSQLLVEAYKKYGPAPDDTVKLLDLVTKAKAFVREYKVETIDDVYAVIKTTSPSLADSERTDDYGTAFRKPHKKTFSLDLDDPDAAELWNVLSGIRYKARGAVLSRMLYQYCARGFCDYYNRLSAAVMLDELQSSVEIPGGMLFTLYKDALDARIETILSLARSPIDPADASYLL